MRDDRDDPFGDIFEEIERMMNEMAGAGDEAGSDVHVSTYQGDGQVRVVADLPGVEEDALDLQCDGETLTLAVTAGDRRAEEPIRLPTRVDEHSAEASFTNGVLQVTFDAVDTSANIDL